MYHDITGFYFDFEHLEMINFQPTPVAAEGVWPMWGYDVGLRNMMGLLYWLDDASDLLYWLTYNKKKYCGAGKQWHDEEKIYNAVECITFSPAMVTFSRGGTSTSKFVSHEFHRGTSI